MKKVDDLQTQLFIVLENHLSRPKLIEELQTLLFIGKSAAYARLSGERELTLTEFHILIARFEIPIDSLRGGDNFIPFYFLYHRNSLKHPQEWMKIIFDEMESLSKMPETHIHYTTNEIPVFYYMPFKELFLFKLYNWGRNIWTIPWIKDKNFDAEMFRALGDPEILEMAKTTFDRYAQINCTELWSVNMLDNTLRQIVYHFKIGKINDLNLVNLLFEQLEEMVEMLKNICKTGQKAPSSSGKITVFHNVINLTSNVILVDSPFAKLVFTSFNNPNFLRTHDAPFFEYTQTFFTNLKECGVQMTGSNELNRADYFRVIKQRIKEAKTEVEIFAN
jgi:hypothetical protein